MKRCLVVLVVMALFILNFGRDVLGSDIVWQDIGRGNMNLRTVLVHPDNPRIIYIGSKNKGIFKTADAGKTWRNVLSIKGANRAINFLLFNPQDRNSLYAATSGGLFHSSNQGYFWKRIFQGKNYFERECTAVAVLPYAIYVGTKGGLFVSKDKGRTWHREKANLGKSHILAIVYNIKEPNYIYVACTDGIFKTKDAGESWERIFVGYCIENGNGEEEDTEDHDEQKCFSDIRYISIDPNNLNHLYLATSKGVYISQDKGESWQKLSDYGLLDRDVRFLLISPKPNLYAVSKSGIFVYKDERWQELSLRLMAEEIDSLAIDNQDSLYAACDKGLFKTNLRYFSNARSAADNALSLYYKDEPSINEVRQAAIKYAEVEPEKIQRWRKQATKRALLPKLTVGMDRDIDRTTSNSIWGTYGSNSSPGKHYVGPDDITHYDQRNWSVSLTWELGDLIYNDDQTSIDVRSRLMVQLRDDILDEVTKLYFERIRVKMELDNLSIEDRKRRFEKELRLHELTAMLDGLTGDYFSQKINNAKGD